jgi:uncharacterized protein YprB with RNaseH-like and TPR domain
MLTNTFCFIKGLSLQAEKRLWDLGVICWEDYLRGSINIFSSSKDQSIKEQLKVSITALQERSIDFFFSRLKNEQIVRLYPHFKDEMAFIDIETTGLSIGNDQITTIALYDGRFIKNYTNGKNLWEFVADIGKYSILVTYNGARFDLPFLRKFFNISLNQFHIDLCPVLRRLGFSGGLKKCEKLMGIKRQIQDMDGLQATFLWDQYQSYNDHEALHKLKMYNAQDVLTLEHIMIKSYNLIMADCPISLKLSLTRQPSLL